MPIHRLLGTGILLATGIHDPYMNPTYTKCFFYVSCFKFVIAFDFALSLGLVP